jgi:ELWxxDGT repeat protein
LNANSPSAKDIKPGGDIYSSTPNWLTNVNGTLFFSASHPGSGTELWMSNGTEAGTMLGEDIAPVMGGFFPKELTNTNGMLLFSATTATHGSELWCLGDTAPPRAVHAPLEQLR